MLPTFPAVLRGDHLEWLRDPPETGSTPVRVHVTLLEPPSGSGGNGPAMAAALTRLAALGTSSFPADASEWQRDERMDRDLPGRED